MKLKLLLLLAVIATSKTVSAEDYILYTSSDGKIINPYNSDDFGVNLISNTYFDGQGKLLFDGDVTKIGYRAFYGSSSLSSVVIPNSVTEVSSSAFSYCQNLITVKFGNSVTTICSYAFSDCYSLTSVDFQNSVTDIGDKSFYQCYSLKSLKFPNSLSYIGEDAFSSCRGLTSVEFGKSLITIGSRAFAGCSEIKSVVLKNSVSEIGNFAFAGCYQLNEIISLNNIPPTVNENSFNYVPTSTCVLKVPTKAVNKYKVAYGWKEFANIEELLTDFNDGTEYSRYFDQPDCDITYTRSFSNTNWQPLYVPFSMDYDDWSSQASVAELGGVHMYEDGSITIEFLTVNEGSLLPNVPYVIKATSTGNKVFTMEGTTLYAAPEEGTKYISCCSPRWTYKLIGNYQTVTKEYLNDNNAYIMGGGNFMHSSNDVKPNRFYLIREKSQNGYWGAPDKNADDIIRIMVDGVLLSDEEVTGILGNLFIEDDGAIFNLNGERVDDNFKGIVIKNGKKTIKR